MKYIIIFVILSVAGCANTTTTVIRKDQKTGAILIESPKNVEITGLDVTLADGTRVKLAKYRGIVDPKLTDAQGKREAGVVGGAVNGAVRAVVP